MSIVAASESIFAKLESTLEALARGGELSESMRDHSLGGAHRGYRECHVESDCRWLRILWLRCGGVGLAERCLPRGGCYDF